MSFKPVGQDSCSLSINDLNLPSLKDKIGYVVDVKSGISRFDDGYYKIFIKTIEGITIPCMIFDLEDFIKVGIRVLALKKKFISFSGTPSINGYDSIILEPASIRILETSQVKDSFKFIGVVSNLDECFNMTNEVLHNYGDFSIPQLYKTESFSGIENGVIGGYVKFVNLWLCQVLTFIQDLSEADGRMIVNSFVILVRLYHRYLSRIEMLDIYLATDKLEDLMATQEISDFTIKRIVADSLNALIPIGDVRPQAEHYFSHILVGTFNLVKSLEYDFAMWKVLPEGGTVKLPCGGILRKF